ncbi:TIR domain-containing protein [Streptomyces asoensis]|uniref:TIR domain-containing protein n=1 Tax=Streptomyces asoensis TaxID=249586 RepID=A0A6M4X1U9_9ACTN|nr:toll/interleukin-1 receptor domain-containing protein [Streptomyces asoensis]QJT02303.1 TIR domain-containing protein [Streptomyces asoensis]
MVNDFITSFAAEEHRAYAARFHTDLAEAVTRRRGRAVEAAMCPGGQGDINSPLIAETRVFVALCSGAYYQDQGCGSDWAVFEHRLHLVPAQFRPSCPPSRVLVRWQPADPPSRLPLAPIISGEVTDGYASKGVYGILREEGARSRAYRDAVDDIAAAVCVGRECSPPEVLLGELPELAIPFPRDAAVARASQAKVPQPRRAEEDPDRPSVFLSYAHEEDGDVHKGKVEALYHRLHAEGIDARMDTAAHRKGPQHWPRWMRKQFNEVDFVLAVVSPAYKRRAEHEEAPGKGDGVGYEADFILDERVTDRQWYERILLVSFPEHGRAYVPDFLRGPTLYTVDPETGEGDLPELVDYVKSKAPRAPR